MAQVNDDEADLGAGLRFTGSSPPFFGTASRTFARPTAAALLSIRFAGRLSLLKP